MPLPKPRADEPRQKFVDRCMGNATMNSEYPDAQQRAAVCHSIFDSNRKSTHVKKPS